jgi:hypothetical protein
VPLICNDGELRRRVSWLKCNATCGTDNNCVLSNHTADVMSVMKVWLRALRCPINRQYYYMALQ